jgi:hypothetical protein
MYALVVFTLTPVSIAKYFQFDGMVLLTLFFQRQLRTERIF